MTEVLFLNFKSHWSVFSFLKMSIHFILLTFRCGPSLLPNHSYQCIDYWPDASSIFCCLSIKVSPTLCLQVSLKATQQCFLKFSFQKVILRFQTQVFLAFNESNWQHLNYYYVRTHHRALP
jgi:hypothetical protein